MPAFGETGIPCLKKEISCGTDRRGGAGKGFGRGGKLFPEGKEQLYLAVAQRILSRHRKGLEAAIAKAGDDLETQLQAAAVWFTSQPPLYLFCMLRKNMPALPKEEEHRLFSEALVSVFDPVRSVFTTAQRKKLLRKVDPGLLTGSLLGIIDGMADPKMAKMTGMNREKMASTMVSVLLDGLRPR